MADKAITCIDAITNGKPDPKLSQPRNLGCRVMVPENTLTLALPGTGSVQLRVGYSEAEIRMLKSEILNLSLIIAFAGIFSSIAIGTVAFGYSVRRPLARLLAAIRDMESGIFRHAKVKSKDEFGELCIAFNSMQDSIELEKTRTEQALYNLRSVYDSAPAFLFTINREGIIQSASKHCLNKLGFAAEEFVEQSLKKFLDMDSIRAFEEQVLARLPDMNELSDIPLQLSCKNPNVSEALLSVVEDRRPSEGDKIYVCVLKDVTELREKEADLRRQSLTDSLTGLPNRRGISHILEIMHKNSATRRDWAVLFIDLDNFKTVNDTFGHEAGDQILIETSRRIQRVIGPNGHAARMGGDEFTVILDNLEATELAEKLGRELVDSISEPVPLSRGIGHVGASVGIAFCRDATLAPGEAIKLADQAMYLAKSGGKNRVVLYDENIASSITDRAHLIQNISTGIPKNWYSVHLQPIINLATMKPYAFEALLRVHPEMGFKGNIEELIKAAEETGQMSKLGKWIFDEAIDQFRTLIGEVAGNDLQISINLSPAQLTPEFVTHAIATARRYPEISGRVILEVTETAALVDFDNARKHLQELREHGFRIAVDDFGTGYSSLSLISRMPIDILKLDQNFATDFQHAVAQSNHAVDGQTALVRCIVTLAKELGVQLIAEGLENTNVVSHFRDLGVLFGQGYIFSRPMPNDQVRDWMDYFRGENEKDPVERLLAAG